MNVTYTFTVTGQNYKELITNLNTKADEFYTNLSWDVRDMWVEPILSADKRNRLGYTADIVTEQVTT